MAVLLFGSQARGEGTAESDVDLFVIAEGLPERTFQRHLYLVDLLPPTTERTISVSARTPKEFESHIPFLYLDLALDGKILYDPSGYAEKRLSYLRQLMRAARLHRETLPEGHYWRWGKQPTEIGCFRWGQ